VGEDPRDLVLVWDLAAAPGIGIHGAGAGNVTRAIMITTLTGRTRHLLTQLTRYLIRGS
jgi:hypothetical protein